MAMGVTLPILPRYVHGPLGSGDLEVGLVVGAFSVTAIVARPWAGRLADVHGRRVIFLVGALVISLGGALMFVPAGVPGAVGARLVVGVGQAAIFTAGSAWAVDLAPSDRRGRTIAWYGLSVWGGLSIGPVLGEALDAAAGYGAVWMATVVLPGIGAAIAWRESADRPANVDPHDRPPLIVREALAPGATLALANVGYVTIASFVGLLLAVRGVEHGALVFPAFACAVVGARLLLGGVPDRLGSLRTAAVAAAGEAGSLAIIASAHGLLTALGGAVLMGAAFAMLYPALALWVVNRVGDRHRGAALGTFTACFDAGFGIGALVSGVIASVGGYAAAFWVAAACAVTSMLVALRLAYASRDGQVE